MKLGDGQFICGPLGYGAQYAVPDDGHPAVKRVKRHAATAARATKNAKRRDAAMDRLRKEFKALSMEALNVWAIVLMIDYRWCGATGQGAYWAVASRICNEAALAELRTRPMFEAYEPR